MNHYRKNIFFAIVCSIFFSCTTTKDAQLPITTSNDIALESFKKGYLHWTQSENTSARQHFQEALNLDPDFILANLFIPETDPNKRKIYRNKAIKNKALGTPAEKLRVEIYEANRNGNATKVVNLSKELVNQYPNSSEAYVLLGDAYTIIRDFDSGIKQYNKALEINPKQYQAWWGLAAQQVNVGQNVLLPKEQQTRKLAAKYTKGMIDARPNAAFSYQLRANVERQYGNFKAAAPLYQKMVDVAEETDSELIGGAYNVFAHNHLFSGDSQTARTYYDKAINLSRSPLAKVNLYFYKLQSYLFQDDYNGALKIAEELENQIDQFGFTQTSLNQQKSRIEFFKFISNAYSQRQDDAYTALNERKKYSTAAMSLMDVDNIQQRNYDATNARMEAWYYILFGEYDSADKKLTDLYSIASKIQSPNALDNYNSLSGMVKLFTGDASGALEYFNDNINPENYQYYGYFKGLALKQVGQTEEANRVFSYLANYNFNSWEASIVRSLAIKQL